MENYILITTLSQTNERLFMSNLKLITTEKFGEIVCNFYRNRNDEILLTREQVGTALEYRNPQKAIDNIHGKHKSRLDLLSVTLKVRATDNKEYDTVLYTERGIMEICRWSRQPKANQFMDWVWDIIEKHRNNELIPDMKPIADSLNKIVTLLENQEFRISKLEEFQISQQVSLPEPTYKKPYNPWVAKMLPKYKLLEKHFDVNRGQLFKNILMEFENIYDLDTSQIQSDYLYENNLTSCYPLEPYEYSPKYRDMIEQIVNSNLIKYGIASVDDPITSKKHITIFDTPIN